MTCVLRVHAAMTSSPRSGTDPLWLVRLSAGQERCRDDPQWDERPENYDVVYESTCSGSSTTQYSVPGGPTIDARSQGSTNCRSVPRKVLR